MKPSKSSASIILALALTMGVLSAHPSEAAEIEGVVFPDQIRVAREPQQLLNVFGVGLLRYRVVFKGYVAAFYLPPGASRDQALEDVPRRLELSYFWSIDGSDFATAADRMLERELDSNEIARLRSRIDELHQAYRDVQPGDRYALTYLPGVGTELELNGETLITIPGSDFAAAYFGMWLGSNPLDTGLRDDLLKLQ